MKTVKRRRREGKTNYSKRLNLLKSRKPRVVFRKTNRYVIAQYVVDYDSQDKVVFGLTSKVFMKFGWPEEFSNSLKSLPASYLLGFLMAKKIQEKKLETPIADFGLQRVIHKSRIFAFLKGLIDGGIEISSPEEAFPEEERIRGKSLKSDFSAEFDKVKSNIEKL